MDHLMKVMVVDDSNLLQDRLKKHLQNVNPELSIQQATNCKDALALFPIVIPDVVILDIDLPDGSGIDLLQVIKEKDPGVKIIMFTNYPTSEFRIKCMLLGANHFIDKSDLTGLKNIINAYPNKRNV